MIPEDIKENLRNNFKHLHPLLFKRSCEYATSPGDLFDILDTVPEEPYAWDAKSRRWLKLDDLTSVNFPNHEG